MPIVWATFLARVSPVSTSAKPACMNITRKPHTSVQTMFSAVWASSASVRASATCFASSVTVSSGKKQIPLPAASRENGQGVVS